jgi:hypothetical protein
MQEKVSAKPPVTDQDSRVQLLASIVDSDDAIISKTADGIITSWNRAAEQIYWPTRSSGSDSAPARQGSRPDEHAFSVQYMRWPPLMAMLAPVMNAVRWARCQTACSESVYGVTSKVFAPPNRPIATDSSWPTTASQATLPSFRSVTQSCRPRAKVDRSRATPLCTVRRTGQPGWPTFSRVARDLCHRAVHR